MTDKEPVTYVLNSELSDREILLIGKIMVEWGALEHEIFLQTLDTFDVVDGGTPELPKAMNNLRFSGVLGLWKDRVIDRASNENAKTLQTQLEEIWQIKPSRDALVHGMWQFSSEDISRISTIRVRNREVVVAHFCADDLEDFHRRLASVNFTIRFPGGIEDLVEKRASQGGYMSRQFLAMMTGSKIADDWQTTSPKANGPESKGK